MKHIRISNSHY